MIILILLCLFAPSFQQPNTSAAQGANRERLKEQAQELSDAVINGNYARAADLTYPKLVRLMGGRKQYIATLEKGMSDVPAHFRLSSVTVHESGEIVQANGNSYVVVPTTMRIKVPEGTLVGDAFMIGISSDGGQNWTFISSGRAINKDQLRSVIGVAADKLQIPEEKRPTLYKEPH